MKDRNLDGTTKAQAVENGRTWFANFHGDPAATAWVITSSNGLEEIERSWAIAANEHYYEGSSYGNRLDVFSILFAAQVPQWCDASNQHIAQLLAAGLLREVTNQEKILYSLQGSVR